jgi:hypothetical protein
MTPEEESYLRPSTHRRTRPARPHGDALFPQSPHDRIALADVGPREAPSEEACELIGYLCGLVWLPFMSLARVQARDCPIAELPERLTTPWPSKLAGKGNEDAEDSLVQSDYAAVGRN